jgi:replication-associated recombination protein RarA
MSLLSAQAGFSFPASIVTKYQPQTIDRFIGLEKQRKILLKLVANPRPCALLFQGASGTGKTSLAFAFAREIHAETHHIGSAECKVEVLQQLVQTCQYVPLTGGMHVIICDEADCMSDASQKYLLSRLDSSEPIPNTIVIFTCNAVDRLEDRFLSRCLRLPEFNSYGAGDSIVALLESVWISEAGDAPAPNFKRMACGNVRESLQKLEIELLAI